jgi:N6-L-threonylcarbamoyladenine synthase
MSPDGTTIILGIESSCDETAAAVLVDGVLRSNVIAGQDVHRLWGGVVPELASRAHQEHIVPVVDEALRQAGVEREQLSGIAFTQGPGLIGALLVGACFARSMAQALHVPLLAVHHIQAHVLAHFVRDHDPRPVPAFPFLNLTVSGGHTQLVLVRGPLDMEVVGTTLDDAAGEAFDKGAKLMGLPYPGGPLVDRHAAHGDPLRFSLPKPSVPGLDMSFSGVKTAFMNLVRKEEQAAPGFVERERDHLCASLQHAIVGQLLRRTKQAAQHMGIREVAIAGGVSANSELRRAFAAMGHEEGWTIHIPPFAYCTDNAAMIAVAGAFLLAAGRTAPLDTVPQASMG